MCGSKIAPKICIKQERIIAEKCIKQKQKVKEPINFEKKMCIDNAHNNIAVLHI
jgi:hypothetical protein